MPKTLHTRTVVGYNQAWDHYKTTYDGLSRGDRNEVNIAWFDSDSEDKIYKPKLSVPSAGTVFVSPCANPSGRCYGYYPDANEHKETCSEKHGPSSVLSVTWWSCHTASCTRSDEHWSLCPGVCNKYFSPKKISRGKGNYIYKKHLPHEVRCPESVWDGFLNVFATCYRKYKTIYYTCQHSTCPVSHNHHNGGSSYYSEPPSGSPSENGGCSPPAGNGGTGNGAPDPNGGCSPAQGAGNDNGGGGSPPSSNGCSTAATCINSNCELPAGTCVIYTCIRDIKNGRDTFGNWVFVPCGEQFTRCNDSPSFMGRGTCSRLSKRRTADLNSGRRYHSDIYP